MKRSYQNLEGIEVSFDDESLVANAGLVLVATLTEKLGLARIISDKVDLRGRVGEANPAGKSLTLVHDIVTGASHIDHVDMLRAGGFIEGSSLLRRGFLDSWHLSAFVHLWSPSSTR